MLHRGVDIKSIRILADDLTGALDTAASFSGQVPVFIDKPPAENSPTPDAQISVVATPTRDIPAEELPAHLQPVLGWLKSGDIAFKKVDSLLRGNTFAELAWLSRSGAFDTTLFAPAFPAQGRVTIDSQQWVIEPGNLNGPRKPAAMPFGEAFAGHGLTVGPDSATDGNSFDIRAPNIISDEELDAVVTQAECEGEGSVSRLWCGSAGLAQALARRHGLVPGLTKAVLPLTVNNDGPTILLTASHHPVLKEQWKLLCAEFKPQALAQYASASEVTMALNAVQKGAKSAWFDLSPTETISQTQAAQLLSEQMAQLISGLPKPAQLIIIGGDTLLSVCRTAGVNALLAQASIRSGWGCARLQGGVWDGVACYSRSGAFGGADDLLQVIRLLDGNINLKKRK